MGSEADKIVEELIESLFQRKEEKDQNNQLIEVNLFFIVLIYYRGGTYIDTPKCIKKILNPKNNDDECL